MRQRPILFSAPMVRALLNGNKTQTRRIIKPQPPVGQSVAVECPYGLPGDRLWVKEAWRADARLDAATPAQIERIALEAGHARPRPSIEYQADRFRRDWEPDSLCAGPGRLRSSIHMPRWASRLLLEIVSVRFERLQDITEADALAEGTHPAAGESAVESYRQLFETLNGHGSWDANPWIWVVEFRRIKSP